VAFRQPGEPAARPFCYPALAAAQIVPTASQTLLAVYAANKSGSVANLTVSDANGEIGSVQVAANSTQTLFGEPGVQFVGALTVTPSAALDVTVVVV
jgi:hypothetical protein